MLHEIICAEFKKKRVIFFPGLNTVLGDEEGTNSIGKSTFLMIVDFVFGGQDYVLKSTDVQRNVGNHIVKFCFIFNDVPYFFSRDTNHQEYVNICDEHYKPISQKTLSEYLASLKEKYSINLPYFPFVESLVDIFACTVAIILMKNILYILPQKKKLGYQQLRF